MALSILHHPKILAIISCTGRLKYLFGLVNFSLNRGAAVCFYQRISIFEGADIRIQLPLRRHNLPKSSMEKGSVAEPAGLSRNSPVDGFLLNLANRLIWDRFPKTFG